MTSLNAIYKNGTFQPTEPVELPDGSHVRIVIERMESQPAQAQAVDEIRRIMSLRFRSGEPDVAERHNEHQRCAMKGWRLA